MGYDSDQSPSEKQVLSPQAAVLNIAIIVGIVGIIVYWVRRFAVFRGYKETEPDILKLAERLKSEAVRERSDVVVAGYSGEFPTIVRFSHQLDTPGLYIQMRVPSTLDFTLMPKTIPLDGQGRVVMRTGNAALDKAFRLRTDYPMEMRMFAGTQTVLASLEQLCCSTQSGLSLKDHTLEFSELTIPSYTANHVFSHLEAMLALASRLQEMPGADAIKIEPLPPRGSSWTIRVALAFGLVSLVALLLAQPYNQVAIHPNPAEVTLESGVPPADAGRIQRLHGWHVARAEDFSGLATRLLQNHGLAVSGRVQADFAGRGKPLDAAYLLTDEQGQRRVCILAGDVVVYDAIFRRLDFLARIPKDSVAKIQWTSAPEFGPDGDALLLVQSAENPSSSLVLLKHGARTYSAHPADFTQIDLGPP
jgi:hypothetical protein